MRDRAAARRGQGGGGFSHAGWRAGGRERRPSHQTDTAVRSSFGALASCRSRTLGRAFTCGRRRSTSPPLLVGSSHMPRDLISVQTAHWRGPLLRWADQPSHTLARLAPSLPLPPLALLVYRRAGVASASCVCVITRCFCLTNQGSRLFGSRDGRDKRQYKAVPYASRVRIAFRLREVTSKRQAVSSREGVPVAAW
jgi:hypothetical protein